MKRVLVTILVILVILGMGASSILIGLQPASAPDQDVSETAPDVSSDLNVQFDGPPAGPPSVVGPTDPPPGEE